MRVIITGATDNRDNMGRFTRVHKSWSLERFDDGYIDADGRFRVYYPNHPRAYKGGYVLRAIVAYETYHGTSVPPDMDIHHIDGNRLKDTEENLEMIPHGFHAKLSNLRKSTEGRVKRICENCNKSFTRPKNRIRGAGKFCSLSCYHSYRREQVESN